MKPHIKIVHLDIANNVGWYWHETIPNAEYNGPFTSRVAALRDLLNLIENEGMGYE